jgi:hypothetical protein
VVFSSFFRAIKNESDDFTRDFSFDTVDIELDENEFVNQDFFKSILSPYMDSITIDSLWQEDSMHIKEWADFSNSMQNLLDPGWYNSAQERSRALRDMLDKYRGNPFMDSLFAQSGFLRDALMKQIQKNLNEYSTKGIPGELD